MSKIWEGKEICAKTQRKSTALVWREAGFHRNERLTDWGQRWINNPEAWSIKVLKYKAKEFWTLLGRRVRESPSFLKQGQCTIKFASGGRIKDQ